MTTESDTEQQATEPATAELVAAPPVEKSPGGAGKRKSAKTAKPTAKAAKRQPPKQGGSMAEFVDGLMLKGMALERLFKLAAAESKKRGIRRFTDRRKFDRYIANRSQRTDKWKVERNGDNIKMTPVVAPAKTPAKTPAKAKAQPRKTGKPVGRKVTKKTEQGRQTVSEPAPAPVAEQTA
jgi:hypothetical protein